jgi:hypothetical protein
MMRYFALLALAAVAMGVACPKNANTDPGALAGTWRHVRGASEPPGFFRQFTLTASDTVLTGSGTWQGEAGPSGALDVSGYTSAGVVHLDFVFHTSVPAAAAPYRGHFDGRLTSATDLTGTITMGSGSPAPEHFAKS